MKHICTITDCSFLGSWEHNSVTHAYFTHSLIPYAAGPSSSEKLEIHSKWRSLPGAHTPHYKCQTTLDFWNMPMSDCTNAIGALTLRLRRFAIIIRYAIWAAHSLRMSPLWCDAHVDTKWDNRPRVWIASRCPDLCRVSVSNGVRTYLCVVSKQQHSSEFNIIRNVASFGLSKLNKIWKIELNGINEIWFVHDLYRLTRLLYRLTRMNNYSCYTVWLDCNCEHFNSRIVKQFVGHLTCNRWRGYWQARRRDNYPETARSKVLWMAVATSSAATCTPRPWSISAVPPSL